MMNIREALFLWFINFFDKKSQGSGANNEIKQNEQLAEELHQPIIRNLKKKKSMFIT